MNTRVLLGSTCFSTKELEGFLFLVFNMNFQFLKNKKTKISLVVRDGEGEVKEKRRHFLRKTKELKKNNNLILFPKPPSVNNAFLTLFLRTWLVRGVDGD